MNWVEVVCRAQELDADLTKLGTPVWEAAVVKLARGVLEFERRRTAGFVRVRRSGVFAVAPPDATGAAATTKQTKVVA